MKKLIFLGLISLVSCSSVWAEEYISSEYYEEMISQPEIIYELNESAIITEVSEAEEYIELLPVVETTIVERTEYLDNEIVSEVKTVTTKVIDNTAIVAVTPYLKALNKAKNEAKIIMLVIRTTDCKYCDEMEVTTLSDSSVKEKLESNFVTVHYNQDLEPLPLGLQEGMTPTFIFVNINEDILNMYPGMRNPEEFKEVLEDILTQ